MLRRIVQHLLAPDSAPSGGAATALAAPPAGGDKGGAPAAPAGNGTPTTDNPPDAEADIFSELDSLSTPEKPKVEPKPADEKPPDDQKPPDDKPDEQKPQDDPKDKPAESDLNTPKGLRKHAQRLETENKQYREQIKQYEQRIAEAAEKGKDATALTERMATLEKEREALQGQIRALKYEASPEFVEKYEKPFKETADWTEQVVNGLEVVAKVDEEGNAVEHRKADFNQDFVPLYQLAKTSLAKATQQAKLLYGDHSPTVMNHINELLRLDYVRGKALAEEQKLHKERTEKEIAEQTKQREWAATAWQEVNRDIAEKNPQYFQPDTKDKQRAEIFNKSIALIDSRHNNKALTMPQKVTLDAQTRLRAAAYPVLQYDLQKKDARIAELEEKLAGKKDSAPGTTQRPGGTATNTPTEKGWSDELNSLE